MLYCTRKIEFDAGHRVIGHEGKCKYLHGHRYVVEASFTGKELDSVGRIIDFGSIKSVLGKWINDNWDHNVILSVHDHELGNSIQKLLNQDVFYMENNPTAENMVKFLFNEICPILFKDHEISCFKIRMYETPNCYAEVSI